MKVNEIERLLARYYDGETSDTEEKELKRFFTEEDVPAHLLAEKEIFMQLAAHPAPEIPEGLESRLSRARKKIREQYNAIMNYESK